MTNKDVHDELTLLGVSSEVHALVDDLDLTLREPPLGERLLYPSRKVHKPLQFNKHVYQPHTVVKEVQGRLFESDIRPVWEVFRMSRKKTKRVRSIVSYGSRKSR